MTDDLKSALTFALAGEWDQAHLIVQALDDPIAAWIHAVLHKMEGDESNSRYWYARARRDYSQYADAGEELRVIERHLAK